MFDLSAPHIIILLIVIVILFGAKRLPGAAQSLGQSMHIFKRSVQGLHDEDQPANAAPPASSTSYPPAAQLTAPVVTQPQPAAQQDVTQQQLKTQQQLADLQRQLAELQQQTVAGNGTGDGQPLTETRRDQQTF